MNCINCNSTNDLKKHYIVPLENGGSDNNNNVCYLCPECIQKLKNKKKVGRPRFELTLQQENVLQDYFSCKIGTSEAKRLIGLTPKNKSTWSRLQTEYRKKYNILQSKNNIDSLRNNKKINYKDKRAIGFMELLNGDFYTFYNTGEVHKK